MQIAECDARHVNFNEAWGLFYFSQGAGRSHIKMRWHNLSAGAQQEELEIQSLRQGTLTVIWPLWSGKIIKSSLRKSLDSVQRSMRFWGALCEFHKHLHLSEQGNHFLGREGLASTHSQNAQMYWQIDVSAQRRHNWRRCFTFAWHATDVWSAIGAHARVKFDRKYVQFISLYYCFTKYVINFSLKQHIITSFKKYLIFKKKFIYYQNKINCLKL